MKIKHAELNIQQENPFETCKLNRKAYGEALAKVVETYAEGFVLSINNPWGTGKTTFIKMWQAMLVNQGFKTVYFNAWENDFDSTPQVALISELGSLTNQKSDKTFKDLVDKAAILSHHVLPAVAKAIVEKYLGKDILKEVIEASTEGAAEILRDEISDYAKKKKGLLEFKGQLERYVKERTEGKPLVILIDELDRCRPTYSVDLLENVKHFFNVPGIVFVLAIDKDQMENAIRGYYNSEGMNAKEYLRRFIDLEFSLPVPEKGAFCRYLYQYFGFSDFLETDARRTHSELRGDASAFIDFASFLFAHYNLTLRQQEKIFARARIALNSFTVNSYLFPNVYIFLIYAKGLQPDFYNKLVARNAPPQEILDDLSQIFPSRMTEENERPFLWTEAELLLLYHNYRTDQHRTSKLYETDEHGKTRLLVQSKVDKSGNSQVLLNVIESSFRTRDIELSHLLKKIDLFDQFMID